MFHVKINLYMSEKELGAGEVQTMPDGKPSGRNGVRT